MRVSAPRCALMLVFLLMLPLAAHATQKRALFDNLHAETAGNADWIIDTDQPLPLPNQNTVTQATPRTYWLGGISSYGIDLVKRGYFVATLINSVADSALGITYNNPANKYDLSRYDVFIVPEPNKRFTRAESTAVFNYVRDGGGLVFVTDHWNSDRDSDGADSPEIYDYLDAQHLFGAHADTSGEANNNIVQDSGNENASLSDSIIHGPNGFADSLSFHNGTTFTMFPGTNASVRGEFWMNGVSQALTVSVMAGSSVYGNGRVFFIGDSSPMDDGSAQAGNTSIFDGWGEAAGRDSILFINATIWATRRDAADGTPPTISLGSPNGGEVWLTGSAHNITWTASDNVGVDSINTDYSVHGSAGPWVAIQHGLANTGSANWILPVQTSDSAWVRVSAFDHALNQAADSCDSLSHIIQDPAGVGAGNGRPAMFRLARPQPNPSRDTIAIRYSLGVAGPAGLEITDVSGRHVWGWTSDAVAAGAREVSWNGRDSAGERVASGIYFVRLVSREGALTVRMVRLR